MLLGPGQGAESPAKVLDPYFNAIYAMKDFVLELKFNMATHTGRIETCSKFAYCNVA